MRSDHLVSVVHRLRLTCGPPDDLDVLRELRFVSAIYSTLRWNPI